MTDTKQWLGLTFVCLSITLLLGHVTDSTNTVPLWPLTAHPLAHFARYGLLIGSAASISAYFILRRSRQTWWAITVLVTLLIPLALVGYIYSSGDWGISDWDYYFSYHEGLRRIILAFQTFPLWNPYTCGGTAGLADPEFPVIGLPFLLELIFGIPLGLRLGLILTSLGTGLGTLALAHRLGLSAIGASVAALTIALSSHLTLKGAEGHASSLFATMWLPWICWAWLNAYHTQSPSRRRWEVMTGLCLALMFYQGGIHLLMYLGVALLVLSALLKNRRRALTLTTMAGLWALGFSALKLIPVLLWIKEFPDSQFAASAFLIPWLPHVFLGRFLHGSTILSNQASGWHEYGFYIGPISAALALFAVLRDHRRPLTHTLSLAAVGIVVVAALGPLWTNSVEAFSWLPRSNISRLNVLALIPLSLLAGHGLDILRRNLSHSKKQFITILVVGLITWDLTSLAAAISSQAFVLPRVLELPPAAAPPLAYSGRLHEFKIGNTPHARTYANALAGYGNLTYCSVLGPAPTVATIDDEPPTPYLTLQEGGGTVHLNTWTPTKFTVTTSSETGARLVVNANATVGWYSNGIPITENKGRLTATVPIGQHETTFEYRAPGLRPGIILSCLTLFLAMIYCLLWPFLARRRATLSAPV